MKESTLFVDDAGERALTLTEMRFESSTLQEIVNTLARLSSDDATETWYPAVWEGRYLHFKPIDFSAPPRWQTVAQNMAHVAQSFNFPFAV